VKRIVIFGYGAVGRETAPLFAARGDDVIVAQRRAPERLPNGIRFAGCDVTSRESGATVGCEVTICAIGFPYDWRLWERAWPAIDALLSACEHTGALRVCRQPLHGRSTDSAADRTFAAHESRP
jgi:predicted dinucleotide-binding enzyme